ncbi:MAG: hypothetical protein M3518_08320 [Actinomycetota bacterium]|nr:hypothetical protein [Actinomycetota bacterium]
MFISEKTTKNHVSNILSSCTLPTGRGRRLCLAPVCRTPRLRTL